MKRRTRKERRDEYQEQRTMNDARDNINAGKMRKVSSEGAAVDE